MKAFYGKWKFSKKRQAWIWKWKNRKVIKKKSYYIKVQK